MCEANLEESASAFPSLAISAERDRPTGRGAAKDLPARELGLASQADEDRGIEELAGGQPSTTAWDLVETSLALLLEKFGRPIFGTFPDAS
uniref:Uncharacterized protein n=1 Tax=Sphaerodactylus townsendi TaxID=933632 RepID=A0ACB8FVN0_9SAUR